MRFHTSHLSHVAHHTSGHSFGHVASHHASNGGFRLPSFQGMFDYMVHGMMWRIGGRLINAMPIMAVVAIAVVIGGYALYKHTRKG